MPGALWRDPQPQDDKAGSSSRVLFEVRREDGQHDSFIPKDKETQAINSETNACTNHACSNSCDCQVNWMIATGILAGELLAKLERFGFVINGKCNTSERWNAIKSGTDPLTGNYLYKPWDSARNDGMIPEKLLPYTTGMTRDQYYTLVETAEMLEAAKVWKQVFTVQYEIIATDLETLKKHSQHAPIALITGFCPGWNDPVVPACELTGGHATMWYGYKEPEYIKDFDSYLPNEKKFAWDYKIGYAIKGVVTLNPIVMKPIPYLPYYEKLESGPAIAAYDPDTDSMLAFSDGRLFKALYGGYNKVKVVTSKEWIRPIKEVFTTKPY